MDETEGTLISRNPEASERRSILRHGQTMVLAPLHPVVNDTPILATRNRVSSKGESPS